MDIPLPVGYLYSDPSPLDRFLPPVDEGVITQVIKRYAPEGGLIFDPFGASPAVAIEAAREGYPVLVAANNPVNRFILQKSIQPFTQETLQAALATLSALPKDDSRMEMVLLDLYRSECNRCGQPVVVEFYVWEKELGGPTHKVYTCDHCAFTGEAVATEEDWNRATDYSRKGLQHAIALEQVARGDDPDRQHAEAALSVYPGRAIFALITLLNKVNQGSYEDLHQQAIWALLITAFDAGNGLWSYPEGRPRPRQLTASIRFKEHNLWRALERAVDIWSMDPGEIALTTWDPGAEITPGQVAIAPLPAREVAKSLKKGQISAVISVPPRPNQAYWSLSALWTAWLWGSEAASTIKVALRRRRYDWTWHAGALRTVLSGIVEVLEDGTPGVVYVPEAEPGFMEAALIGFDASGFALTGRAFRAGEQQAFLQWVYPGEDPPTWDDFEGQELVYQALHDSVIMIGEPVPYPILHAGVWSAMAKAKRIASAVREDQRGKLLKVNKWIESSLGDPTRWQHLSRGTEIESGSYWFTHPPSTDDPLFDRVERMVLGMMRTVEGVGEVELDRRICEAFPGISTPDRRLVLACLYSYAQRGSDGLWTLRAEDYKEARQQDCEAVHSLLRQLGQNLGFAVPEDGPLRWQTMLGETAYTFRVSEMASWGWEPSDQEIPGLTMVIPGGRSVLVAEKARRDPRVREWMETPGKVIKFRHVRRLASDANLTGSNFAEQLAIDPPERQDPQMPLL